MKTAPAAQAIAACRPRTDKSVIMMELPRPVERRKLERLPLQLSLQFSRVFRREEVIECVTENISGEGIYFISLRSLIAGEQLEIDLLLPPLKSGHNLVNVHLRCRAQVVRIDSKRQGPGIGVACRIEQYTIRFGDADLLRDRKFHSAKT
jgi:PilZ domain